MDTSMRKLVSSFVVLLLFLALLPTMITNVIAAAATTGIDTSAASMLNIFQLLIVVGGIGLTSMRIVKASRS